MTNNRHSKTLAKSYYMYGKHPVLAALNNQHRNVERLFCDQEFFNAHKKTISSYKYEIVTNHNLNQLLKQPCNHQGIIAKVQSVFCNNIDDLVFTDNSKLVILDQITDPQNIGSIIRSAAAFDIQAIIMPTHHTPDENATIAKAASGALEFVKIVKVTNLQQIMQTLKNLGFWIIGFDGNTTEYPRNNLFTGKIIMVFGAEDTGMRRLTAETCDYLVKIPISKNIESLNVANAATIAFYLSCS
ncbi:23S rRNA (guanosine(2251)-2'-O)-methyltransferase RlmB [Candidatus Trichorickettsia mobilis]|uniref:23S rRNA (guanosine(2251)-2'-O)-methyltransferase RlmB n=1 Tax=Candidatus Trichorickettsia mobilis TaxID=1346319 RepID=UPI00292FC36C|nr:23S rRNA (guanosine(2251)-2'-O)-methyltransferase RlmB [Candidatus Trichorickettsia mobilis]